MNKATSIVEINGQRYDAVTGKLIGAVKRVANHAKSPVAGLSLDGFTRKSAQSSKAVKSHARRVTNAVGRKTQHSKTLMRQIVKRPKHQVDTSKKQSNVNQARAFRAKLTPQNEKVRRFGLLSFSRDKNQSGTSEAAEGEIISPKMPHMQTKSAKSMALATTMPGVTASTSHQQLERLLDYALAKADAHKKSLKHSAKRPWHRIKILPKWLSVSIGVLILGGLAGFLVWQNVPQVHVKVAAVKANIQATMPSYTPAGFSYAGSVKSEDGAITIPFKASNDASKTYTVKEQVSKQDSASLAANVITPGQQVQTSQEKGVTIYIFGDGIQNNAACANNGSAVQIENNASLNTDQLLNIARSVC